eukprot:scaffold163147_cov37-Prasinocladus_malaysianus.AAC.1
MESARPRIDSDDGQRRKHDDHSSALHINSALIKNWSSEAGQSPRPACLPIGNIKCMASICLFMFGNT